VKAGTATLAAVLAAVGVTHLTAPRTVEALVPAWVPGSPSFWNLASAAAELSSAALLLSPRTRRVGGAAAFVTLCVVYVANVQHAIDGSIPGAPGWLGSRAAALARLPLQLPLLWWAWRAGAGEPSASRG
jgi:uncharacterized membrane protein